MKNRRSDLMPTRWGFRLPWNKGECMKSIVVNRGIHQGKDVVTIMATGSWRKHLWKFKTGVSRLCRRCGSGSSMALAN